MEEDETVTDCNEYSTVEEELDTFIKSGKAIKEENCGTYTITYIDPLKVARHFYEHGLNARKENRLTLEEAIIHCKEKACDNTQCALEHRQLAEWLEELQQYRKNARKED